MQPFLSVTVIVQVTGRLGSLPMTDLYQCLVEAPGSAEHANEVGDRSIVPSRVNMIIFCRLCAAQAFTEGIHLVDNAIVTVSEIMHQLGLPSEQQHEHAALVLLRGRLQARTGQVLELPVLLFWGVYA